MFEICNDKTNFLFWPKRPPRTKQSKSPLQGIGFVLTRSTGRQMPLRLSVLCTTKCKSTIRGLAGFTSVAAIGNRTETTTDTNFLRFGL